MSPKPERYALLNVTDMTGIVELGYDLHALGFKLISAGATAKALKQAELEVLEASELIQSSERLEGPLGMLHPRLLVGITADRARPGQMHELERRKSVPIDLVAINLYPVADIIGDKNMTQEEILEYIDLAGATLLKAAARNFKSVIPLCDPDDYVSVIDSLRQYDRVHPEKRQNLASKAFLYTGYYDSTVAQYLGGKWGRLPEEMVIGLKKTLDLNYGENPQQQAALYTRSGGRPWGITAATLHSGKPLSYNHYLDLEVAWEFATEVEDPACVIVKHGVPAGAAASESLAEAAKMAYRCDPRGAFRGTAACNREIDEESALFFAQEYIDLIAAPQFSEKAMTVLRVKKDIRLVTLPSTLIAADEMDLRAVAGGVLVQEMDHRPLPPQLKVPSKRQPTEVEMKSLKFAWHAARHSRTHAAVVCRGSTTIGIGSGQTARLDSIRLALVKSQERHPILPAGEPMVLSSDGVLSAEHIQEAAAGGITAVIQPGGSSEDKDAVEACDRKNIAMVFTGARQFRH